MNGETIAMICFVLGLVLTLWLCWKSRWPRKLLLINIIAKAFAKNRNK